MKQSETLKTGRVTIPTNLDVVPETIEILKRWGADAIRDCDGTEFPEELTQTGAKIIQRIIRHVKITYGPGPIRMRCSSAIL